MSIITHTGHTLSIKDGILCARERESNSLGIVKIKDLILIYDEHGGSFSVYGDNIVYGYFIRVSAVDSLSYSLIDIKLNKFISYIEHKNKLETRKNLNEWEIFKINNFENYRIIDKEINDFGSIFFDDISSILKRAFISALIEVCSVNDFNLIGKKMYDDMSYNIENIFPENNIYIKEIKKTREWLSKRNSKKRAIDITGKYNDIYHTSKGNGLVSTEEKILHSFRRSVPPIINSAVVATARNEGVYLLDWISHYQALGFNDIFIYSNNNSDGSDALLKALSDNGIIFWINNDIPPLGDAQSKSYSHALMLNEQILNYRWAAFFDLDEFLVINSEFFNGVNDFLSWHEFYDTDIIGINWTFVGSNSEVFWKNDEMYKRFDVDSSINPHIKSIIKPNKFIGSRPHYPCWYYIYNPSFRESDRTEHKYNNVIIPGEMSFSENPTNEYATLYHYFHKSAEEFLWKFSRNRGDYPAHIGDIKINIPESLLIGFINDHKSNHKKSKNYDVQFLKKKDDKINSLLSIADINSAQMFVLNSFEDRMNRIKLEFSSMEKTEYEKTFYEILKNTYEC